jgi:hypothetical protein
MVVVTAVDLADRIANKGTTDDSTNLSSLHTIMIFHNEVRASVHPRDSAEVGK